MRATDWALFTFPHPTLPHQPPHRPYADPVALRHGLAGPVRRCVQLRHPRQLSFAYPHKISGCGRPWGKEGSPDWGPTLG